MRRVRLPVLLAVPFAGFDLGSIGALIATPDRTQPPSGGGPHGDDPPTVSPPPDGGTARSPDNSHAAHRRGDCPAVRQA